MVIRKLVASQKNRYDQWLVKTLETLRHCRKYWIFSMCLIYLNSDQIELLTPWFEFSPRFLRCYLFVLSFAVMLNPVRIVKIAKIAIIVKMNFERVAKIPN